MEANREAAEQCLAAAKRAAAAGDVAKAQRMLSKARALYPDHAQLAVVAAAVRAAAAGAAGGNPTGGAGGSGGARAGAQPSPQPSSSGATSASAGRDPGTPEEIAAVRRILRAECPYEVLGLSKGCADTEVKKAYRKTAIKLHPDKNKAEGAEEAFKKVSKAYAVLSDSDKRANYDRFGMDDEQMQAAQAAGARRAYRGGGGGFDGEIDPEEIFRQFFGTNFGGGMDPRARVFRTQFGGMGGGRRQQRPMSAEERRAAQAAQTRQMIMQFVPILLVMLFTLFASDGTGGYSYSLDRSSAFPVGLSTEQRDVPFFVPSVDKFDRQYPPGTNLRKRQERAVEEDYHEVLSMRCQAEKRQERSRRYRSRNAVSDAYPKPHCDELEEKFADLYTRRRSSHSSRY